MRRIALLLLFATLALIASTARGEDSSLGKHPHFDDGGTLRWAHTFAQAKRAALRERKLIFVEYGRAACSNCKTLAERTLKDERVATRLPKVALGLAAECDPPLREDDVLALFRKHLPKAKTLPFVAMLTHEGEWISGFSGYADADRFLAFLDEADESPLLRATPEVERKLDRLLIRANEAEADSDWRGVFRAVAESDELRGKSPVRAALEKVAARAHEWAKGRLNSMAASLAAGGDRTALRRDLRRLGKVLGDHPLSVEVEAGLSAAKWHAKVQSAADEGRREELRREAWEDLADTGWAIVFAPPESAESD